MCVCVCSIWVDGGLWTRGRALTLGPKWSPAAVLESAISTCNLHGVRSLGLEDLLEKGLATYSSILA